MNLLRIIPIVISASLISFDGLSWDMPIEFDALYVREGGSGAAQKSRCNIDVLNPTYGYETTFTLSHLTKDGIPEFKDDITQLVTNGSTKIPSAYQLIGEIGNGHNTPNSPSCSLTDMRIEGLGRANIDYFGFSFGGNASIWGWAYFNSFEGKSGAISDLFVAGQLLALPIAAKLAKDNSLLNDLSIVTKNLGITPNYDKYAELVTSGETGFNGDIFGFSIDFLDLRTKENINEFLAKRSVELAIKVGLVSSNVDVDALADRVRIETLHIINQDSSQEYGSVRQIKASLAMKYSGVTSSGWQVNPRALKQMSIDAVNRIPTDFYYSDKVRKRVKREYGVDNLQDILDFIVIRQETNSSVFDTEFAKKVLQVNGISVDTRSGMITNKTRYGGYLGKTYLTIAEDVYRIPTTSLTYGERLVVKTALNALGIDTNFAYGSLSNIQSSVMMRLDASISESAFNESINEGSSPEMLNALSAHKGLNFDDKVKDLLMRTYVYSGITSLEEGGELLPLPLLSDLNVKLWEESKKGTVDDYYIYSNPYTKTIDFFQLKTPAYGLFPTNQTSNAHWEYKGIRHWNQKGNKGDIYIYDNPYNDDIELFLLVGNYGAFFPTNKTSSSDWKYLDMGDWVLYGKGNKGDIYLYENPVTQELELFALNHNDTYSYFPTDKSNNRDWTYIDSLKKDIFVNKPSVPAERTLNVRFWNDVKTGTTGHMYIYDNPYSRKVDFFELKNSNYSYFPTDGSSSAEWKNRGIRKWGEYGEKGDMYIYSNPYTNKIELFQLTGNHERYLPTNGKSSLDWMYVQLGEWKLNGRGSIGDIYIYHNPKTNDYELFSLKTTGNYSYFPTDKSSNHHWQYAGTLYSEARGDSAPDSSKFMIYEHHDKKGRSRVIDENIPFLDDFNDIMSSWSIPSGWQVRFYEHSNYTGRYLTRSSGTGNADEFHDVVSSIKILKRSRSIDGGRSVSIVSSASVERTKDVLYDTLVNLSNQIQTIYSYEKVVDYNGEGAPIYSIPLTDVAYTKALLYDIGYDNAWVERNWQSFFDQTNSRRPSLLPWYPGGAPAKYGNKLASILSQFEAETGRRAYNVQDMWSHYFDKMVDDISDYIAVNIAFKAQMMGKASWLQTYERKYTVQLHTSYDVVKTRWNSPFWKETERIDPKSWVVSSDGFNYSAILGNSILNMFYINGLQLGDPIPLNAGNDSPLFRYLNNDSSNDCLKYTLPPDDLVYNCESQKTTKESHVLTERDAIRLLVQKYLHQEKHVFKTIKTDDILLEVIKGFLPLWGTIEDIKAGNMEMAVLGIIGDVMFFAPVADDFIDAARFTVKAVKKVKPGTSAKFIQSPVSLSNGDDALLIGGKLDRAYYARKAAESVGNIPFRLLNELNPLSFGDLDNIFAIGRVDVPKVPDIDRFIPNSSMDVQEFLGAKYNGDLSNIIRNSDGTYTINNKHAVIKIGDYFYLVKKDSYGRYYLVDSNGNIKFPVVENNGSWEVDFNRDVTNYDISNMRTINASEHEFTKLKNGIYKIDDKQAIKINGQFYEVVWDPVFESWYMYDRQWNRLLVSGEYNGKWFVNSMSDICSI